MFPTLRFGGAQFKKCAARGRASRKNNKENKVDDTTNTVFEQYSDQYRTRNNIRFAFLAQTKRIQKNRKPRQYYYSIS
jgi:hypothetical protein